MSIPLTSLEKLEFESKDDSFHKGDDPMASRPQAQPGRAKIAVFSGPTATIQNSEPLVTSNKAREKYGHPPRANPDGSPARFDVLRPQRLAAPVTVYIEQFS